MDEVWKDIRGYEGRYMVSNFGRVKSLPNHLHKDEFMLTPFTDRDGYKRVKLYSPSQKPMHSVKIVSRLVAIEFIDNPHNKEHVNHIDCDKTNNNVENLEWCTICENTHHAIDNGRFPDDRRALSTDDVKQIRTLYGLMESKWVAFLYGVSTSHINRIWRYEMRMDAGWW